MPKRLRTEVTEYNAFIALPVDVLRNYLLGHFVPLCSKQCDHNTKTWRSLISLVSTCTSLYKAKELFFKLALEILRDPINQVEVLSKLIYPSIRTEYEKEVSIREELQNQIEVFKQTVAVAICDKKWTVVEEAVMEDKELFPMLGKDLIGAISELSVDIDDILAAYPERRKELTQQLDSIKKEVFSLWIFETQKAKKDSKTSLSLGNGQLISKVYKGYKQMMKNYKELRRQINL